MNGKRYELRSCVGVKIRRLWYVDLHCSLVLFVRQQSVSSFACRAFPQLRCTSSVSQSIKRVPSSLPERQHPRCACSDKQNYRTGERSISYKRLCGGTAHAQRLHFPRNTQIRSGQSSFGIFQASFTQIFSCFLRALCHFSFPFVWLSCDNRRRFLHLCRDRNSAAKVFLGLTYLCRQSL